MSAAHARDSRRVPGGWARAHVRRTRDKTRVNLRSIQGRRRSPTHDDRYTTSMQERYVRGTSPALSSRHTFFGLVLEGLRPGDERPDGSSARLDSRTTLSLALH